MSNKFDIVVIGGGPIGLFCAFQAGMLGMSCAIIDSMSEVGGQCTSLYPEKPIYDIPGYHKILAGDLVANLKKQTSRFPVEYILNTTVDNIKGDSINGFDILTINDTTICYAKVIIMAYGCGTLVSNKIPLPEAQCFENKTLFYSVKNKQYFQDKQIAIVGGGDSALDWAIELANVAKSVKIIHRRDVFSAIPNKVEELNKRISEKKIELITPYHITKINGDISSGQIYDIMLQNFHSSADERKLSCDYVLAFFGITAKANLAHKCKIETKFNCVIVNQSTMESNVAGIFAIGDCVLYNNKLKLILTGFSEAATAVWSAYQYVFGKKPHFQHSTSMF